MFKLDIKRIKVCIEHNDYYSASIYIDLIIENYSNEKKSYFKSIQKKAKTGKYNELKKEFNLK